MSAGGARAAHDEAVSDVVGSVLMVAITVIVMVALAMLVSKLPGPQDEIRATLVTDVLPGADLAWATGDEQVRVRNVGGEPVERSGARIVVEINGARTEFSGTALTGGFSDGKLSIGETWTRTTSIALGDEVLVDIVGGRQLLGSASIVAQPIAAIDCSADTTAPVVAQWTQTPSDVTITTSGAVTVRARATDGCAGVNTSVAPTLFFRLNGGSNPSFTDAGVMSSVGTAEWSGTIPAQTWSTHLGKTLEYYVGGLKDLKGNTGNSVLRQDVIGITGTPRYVDDLDITTGSFDAIAPMKDANDAGAFTTLTETNTGGAAQSATLVANAVITSTGWTNPTNAYLSNDLRATQTANGPTAIRYGLSDMAGTGTATSVIIRAEVQASKPSAQWRLEACLGAVCSARSANLGTSATDIVLSYDVTTKRPGGGTWSVADINALEVRVIPSNGTGSTTYRIDHVSAAVTVDTATYRMDIMAEWQGIPALTTHFLELRYRTTGDTYSLQLWNGAAWTTRATLNSGSMTVLYYQLTAGEYNGGAPLVRFLDVTSNTTPGTLAIDYARVVSA